MVRQFANRTTKARSKPEYCDTNARLGLSGTIGLLVDSLRDVF